MKFKFYLFFIAFTGTVGLHAQQQSLFTNILLHQYYYNPAYAGVSKSFEFNLHARNQWVGFDGAPRTVAASVYSTFKKHTNMAAGGLITYDRAGLIGRTSFYGSYAYHLKLGDKMNIGFGLSVGGVQYNVKIYDAKPYPDDKDDIFLRSDVLNAMAFDANSGLYLYSRDFFLGFSAQQMANTRIRWDNTLGKLVPLYYLQSGYTFHFDKKRQWGLQPSVLARFSPPHPYQMEYSLRLIYKDMIWLGGTYRSNSSACGMFGVTIDERYRVGYSYDYTLSKLNNYSAGSHELVFTYLIPVKKKKTIAEKVQDADEEELNKIDNSIKTNLRNKKNDDKKTEEKKNEEPK